MYKCYDCDLIFEEPRRIFDSEGEMTWQGTSYPVCPNCGGYHEEVVQCIDCDEWIFEKDMYDNEICKDCYEEREE